MGPAAPQPQVGCDASVSAGSAAAVEATSPSETPAAAMAAPCERHATQPRAAHHAHAGSAAHVAASTYPPHSYVNDAPRPGPALALAAAAAKALAAAVPLGGGAGG